MRERIEYLASWVKSTVANARMEGIVLGLSGGLDSAVLCGLCSKAIGQENVLAVMMPCYSNKQDRVDALKVATKFNVRHTTIILNKPFDLLSSCFLSQNDIGNRRVAKGNLKARLRMVVLYYIANQTNCLVAGSDDKSENYIGYFTKYGDGASDFAPLTNSTKTEVREMAKELGVPKSIIQKPPSPGLWEGQTAEGELGVTYKEIDAFLAGKAIPPNARKKIELLHQNTEHKRTMPYTKNTLEDKVNAP